MNGLGNAFAIFDARGGAPFIMRSDMAKAVADPQTGIGCDQVIVMERALDADVFMRIWNADGSEVNACGNATRCVAWHIMEETGRDRATVQTEAGILKAVRVGKTIIGVDMGPPKLGWEDIPLAERMDTRGIDVKLGPIDNPYLSRPGAVNMGNPHCVFFVEDVMDMAVEKIGPMVEFHPMFPQQVNVGFAEVRGDDAIRLRVWERGAGLTKACGTGACAAVVAAHRRRLTGRTVTVELDGGDLFIEWRPDNHVYMTGPIELTAQGEMQL